MRILCPHCPICSDGASWRRLTSSWVVDLAGVVPGEERVEQPIRELFIHVAREASVEFALERGGQLGFRGELRQHKVSDVLERLPVSKNTGVCAPDDVRKASCSLPALQDWSSLRGKPHAFATEGAKRDPVQVEFAQRLGDGCEDRDDLTGRQGDGGDPGDLPRSSRASPR